MERAVFISKEKAWVVAMQAKAQGIAKSVMVHPVFQRSALQGYRVSCDTYDLTEDDVSFIGV